jgi:hypothetical protein
VEVGIEHWRLQPDIRLAVTGAAAATKVAVSGGGGRPGRGAGPERMLSRFSLRTPSGMTPGIGFDVAGQKH